MDPITLIVILLGAIVLSGPISFVITLKLRARINKVEEIMARLGNNLTARPTYQTKTTQAENHQIEIGVSSPIYSYIIEQFKNGVDKESIKTALVNNGWQLPDVEKTFNLISSKTQLAENQLSSAFTPTHVGPTPLESLVVWLKEEWLLKVGAFLLLIGFGWLATYAFMNNWIGPVGRIALGLIAGTLILILGWWRIKKYINQGGIFLVLGSTTILLTTFAAREIYNFFTPSSALAVMFLSTAFVAFVSVKYKSQALSLISIILAGIAPLLTNAPSPDYVSLFLYLLVVVVGAIWVVLLTGQRGMTIAALLLVAFYSLPHLFLRTSADDGVILLFVYVFAAIFFITNTLGIIKLKDKSMVADLVTASGNALFLLVWIVFAGQDEWRSLIISAWMVLFAVGAFLIFRITQKREPFYIYAGIGVAMLAAATATELKGASLIIAYTIESGVIALISYVITKNVHVAIRISVLLLGPIMLSPASIMSSLWKQGVFHKDFFVLLVLASTITSLGAFFLSRLKDKIQKETSDLTTTLLIVGSVYFYILWWLSLRAAFVDNNIAVMIALASYTIVGIICYLYGVTKEKKVIQIYGGLLVGLVVARLLLVDIWNMDLAGRIITFFLIGALLVSTAFLGKGKDNLN